MDIICTKNINIIPELKSTQLVSQNTKIYVRRLHNIEKNQLRDMQMITIKFSH